jgi:hypothetical protein
MKAETEEGPLLTLTFSLTEQEAKGLAMFLARAARDAEGDREAHRLKRALAPLREALAKAGYPAR